MSLSRRLELALTAVAEALESGDAVAAAAASEHSSRVCLEAVAAGERVPFEDLPALVRAQARADAAARTMSERLVREMDVVSLGRRASEAYGR